MRSCYASTGMAIIQNNNRNKNKKPKCYWGCEELPTLVHCSLEVEEAAVETIGVSWQTELPGLIRNTCTQTNKITQWIFIAVLFQVTKREMQPKEQMRVVSVHIYLTFDPYCLLDHRVTPMATSPHKIESEARDRGWLTHSHTNDISRAQSLIQEEGDRPRISPSGSHPPDFLQSHPLAPPQLTNGRTLPWV